MSLRSSLLPPITAVVAALVAASVALGGTGHSRTDQPPTDQASRQYHPVYFDERSLTYEPSAGDQDAPLSQQVPLYQVSYPADWRRRGLATPQCAPCDHTRDGVTFEDFHDHVAGRGPKEAGRRPKWHVYGVVPNGAGGPRQDRAIDTAYAALLPARSDVEVMRLLTAKLEDGAPVARLVDYGFNFTAPFVPNSKRRHGAR